MTFDEELFHLPYAAAKTRVIEALNVLYKKRLLELTNGNVSEAARRAEIERSNWRRLFGPSYEAFPKKLKRKRRSRPGGANWRRKKPRVAS